MDECSSWRVTGPGRQSQSQSASHDGQLWCDFLRAKMSLRFSVTRGRSCFGVWQDVWQNLQQQLSSSSSSLFIHQVLQCFDAVGWAAGRAPAYKKLSAGMVICLQRGADLHMAQLMPLPLTVSCFSKIQIGFYLSGTVCVCVCIYTPGSMDPWR